MASVESVVYDHLARSLGCSAAELASRADEDLEALGLDSHGLMSALLGIERALGLSALDPDDGDLASPRSLIAAIERAQDA